MAVAVGERGRERERGGKTTQKELQIKIMTKSSKKKSELKLIPGALLEVRHKMIAKEMHYAKHKNRLWFACIVPGENEMQEFRDVHRTTVPKGKALVRYVIKFLSADTNVFLFQMN